MASSPHVPVTDDALIQHRLRELEELAAGWHSAERRVDTLGLSIAAVEKSVTSIADSLEKNAAAMSRLHERLDSALTQQAAAQAREQGRAEAQTKTWKVIAWTASTTIMLLMLVVAALNFALN